MKHSNDHDAGFIGMIEKRVREPMHQNSAKCSMHELECERSLLRQSNGLIDAVDEIVGQLTRDVAVPRLRFAEIPASPHGG